jgi:hypothetical protein
MKFNAHYNLQGKHAFLGASKWNWINYDEDKLITTYQNFEAVERGTRLHSIAASMISEGIKAQKCKQTFNMYVNDAIGYGMSPEVVLYYSDFVFGTTDAIKYDEKRKILRIHDLKTGITPAHMEQLMIYAALFCLEYRIDPFDMSFIELRLYQSNDILICNTETNQDLQNTIKNIMSLMINFNNRLERYSQGK